MRIPQRWFLGAALVLALIGAPFYAAQTQSTAPRAAATGERIIRTWHDTVKIHGRDEPRTIEVLYDYDAGVALRRTYDADGALLYEQQLAAQPQPSPQEIAEAISLVAADPELSELSEMASAQFDGGFILDEADGEPCAGGARCLQVFMLSESRWGLLRHTAVDLKQRRITHRSLRSNRADP